jgi:hypothetical protein
MNQRRIIYILKCFIPGDKIWTIYLLLTFSRTKLTVVLLWILLIAVMSISPSARRVTAVNNIGKSLDVFNKHNISLQDTFSFA